MCEGPNCAGMILTDYVLPAASRWASPTADGDIPTARRDAHELDVRRRDLARRDAEHAFPQPESEAPAKYVRIVFRALGVEPCRAPRAGRSLRRRRLTRSHDFLPTESHEDRRTFPLRASRARARHGARSAPVRSPHNNRPRQPQARPSAPPFGSHSTTRCAWRRRRATPIEIARAGVTRATGQRDQVRSQYLPAAQRARPATAKRSSRSSRASPRLRRRSTRRRSVAVALHARSFRRTRRPTSAARAGAGGLVPIVHVGGGFDLSKTSFGATNQWTLGLAFSQNVYTGGRITAQNDAADAQLSLGEHRGLGAARAGRRSTSRRRTTTRCSPTSSWRSPIRRSRETDVVLAQTTRRAPGRQRLRVRAAARAGDARQPAARSPFRRASNRQIAYLRLKQLLNMPLDDSLHAHDAASRAPADRRCRRSPRTSRRTRRRRVARRCASSTRRCARRKRRCKIARAERIPSLAIVSNYQRLYFPQQRLPELEHRREQLDGRSVDELSDSRRWAHQGRPARRAGRRAAGARAARADAPVRGARHARRAESLAGSASVVGREPRHGRAGADAPTRSIRCAIREGISTQTDLTQSRLLARAGARESRAGGAQPRRRARAARAVARPADPADRSRRGVGAERDSAAAATTAAATTTTNELVKSGGAHTSRRRRHDRGHSAMTREARAQHAADRPPSPPRCRRSRSRRVVAVQGRRRDEGGDDADRHARRPREHRGREGAADSFRSGDLRHAGARGAGERARRSRRRGVADARPKQGERVAQGQTLARIDDATLREAELSARAAVTTAQNTADIDEAAGRSQRGADQGRRDRRARSRAVAAISYSAARGAAGEREGDARERAEAVEQSDGERAVHRHRERATGERGRRRAAGRRAVHDRESVDDASRGVGAGRPAVGGAHRRAGGFHGQRLSESRSSPVTSRESIRSPIRRRARCGSSCRCRTRTACWSADCSPTATWRARCARRRSIPLAAVDERGLKPFVMRIKNGLVEKTEVELGIRDAATETVEIAAACSRATRFCSARRAASRRRRRCKVQRVVGLTGRSATDP